MSINNIFYNILTKFSQEVGVDDSWLLTIKFIPEVLLTISFLSCFFGFRLFRWWSAFMGFLITGIGVSELLKSVADKAVIVTTVVVIGLAGSFLAYQFYKASAIIICGLIGYNLTSLLLFSDKWICFAGALLFAILASFFTDYLVIISSSIWGGFTFCINALSYFPVDNQNYFIINSEYLVWLVTLLFITLGIVVQYKTNQGVLKYRRSSGSVNTSKGGI